MTHRILQSDPAATQPIDVPGPAATTGDAAPDLGRAGAQADPTPAAPTAASAEREPRDGDPAGAGRPPRDGKGRFLARVAIPPMGGDLAQALLDASAEAAKVDTALQAAAVRVAAVSFADRVRNGGGGAA